MTVEDLFLSTISDGALYSIHCRYGYMNATAAEWRGHVIHRALPHYRHATLEVHDGLPSAEIDAVAARLKAYYETHVRELDEPA